jgi:CHAT domain-containing protein/tetratricopeptide (TPR) repeat protein
LFDDVPYLPRHWLAALLLTIAVPLHAASADVAASVEAIERASGAGDFDVSLRLSGELLEHTRDGDAVRIMALQARADALVDAGEWTKQSAALHAAIGRLPDPSVREALEICFSANDAVNSSSYPALLEAAHKGLERNFREPRTFVAEMHAAAAKALVGSAKPDPAHDEAQAALTAWHVERGLRARRYEIAMNLILSQIEQGQGQSDTALQRAVTAGRLAAEAFGEGSLTRTRANDQRAAVLEALDRFAEARELREATLKATREHYGDHHLRTAQAEGALGAHLQRTGNYAPAREHYAAAESIMRARPDAGLRERVILANNYANLLQEMGDEDAALAHYRIALDLVTDDRTRAVILTNIGNTEFRLQRYEQAIADFNQALPLREKAEGKDAPGLSFALEGLGSSVLVLKRYAEAEKYFARAIELRGKNSAPNHSQLNVLNFGLALARWGQGNDADAFRLAVQTAERQQGLLGSLATGFSEQQSVAFDNLLVPATPLAVTIAAQHGDAGEIATAWRLVMVERGLIARAESRRLAIARASADPQLAQLYRDWRAANSALGDGWISSRTSAAKMSELQAAAEAAERTLWAKLGRRQDNPADAAGSVADLALALPKDGLLIAFTEGVSRDAGRIVNAGVAQAPEDLYAFVLRPRAAPKLLRIGRAEALAAQTRAWYAALRDPRSDPAQLHRRGDDLRHDLFDPLGALASRQTLFVVPVGELFRVNFAALPGSSAGHYLIESGLRVHTLSHEGDLLLGASATADGRILLAGAPQFGMPGGKVDNATASSARQLCARVAEQGFAPIPGAERELDGLRVVLRSALGTNARVDLLDGAQATKEHVLAALDGADVVHLATHGFSFDESCGAAESARGIVLDHSTAGPAPAAQPLSGLAFSGADVGSGHAPVGVLSAGEMSTADLSHAGWVVLSACDSGLGPIGRTEGVFGMRRALRLAGARTVVMSLWEADDTVTADLMQALYRARFGEHRNVPDAMARSMRAILDARRAAHQSTHPYYWAAFVGEGGWR